VCLSDTYIFLLPVLLIVNRHDCYSWRDNWISRTTVDEEKDGIAFCWTSDFEVRTVTQLLELTVRTVECKHIKKCLVHTVGFNGVIVYKIWIPWPEIFSTCLCVMRYKSHNYEGIWSYLLQAHISESIHNIEGFNRFIFLKILIFKWYLELVCFKFAQYTQYTLSTKEKRFSARQHMCYSALYAIVCLSVRPSHGWISQRRLKLRSRNLHTKQPHDSSFLMPNFTMKFQREDRERGAE